MTDKQKLPRHCRLKSGGQIEVRINVPEAARERIGKTALVKSLGMVTIKEAHELAPAIIAEFKQRIKDAKARPKEDHKLSRDEILKRLSAWRQTIFTDLIVEFDAGRRSAPDYTKDMIEQTAYKQQRLDGKDVLIPHKVRKANNSLVIAALNMQHDFEINDNHEPELHRVIDEIVDDHRRLTFQLYDGESGSYDKVSAIAEGRSALNNKDDTALPKSTARQTDGVGVTLTDAFERWCKSHERKGKSVKTTNDFNRHIDRFKNVYGNIDIGKITTEMIERYADLMLDYPSRPNDEIRRMSVTDAIAKAKDKGLKPLSPVTVKTKSLGAISAVLASYVNDGTLSRNPVNFDIVASNDGVGITRSPFEEIELRKIFSHGIFRGDKPSEGGKGPAATWLPVISLLTGARLEELAQLEVDDINLTHGEECIHIALSDGVSLTDRRLKNRSSQRSIPISRKLKELGFIKYVNAVKMKTGGRLFAGVGPEKRYDSDAQRSAAWSKYFGRFLNNKIGIADPQKVFHSFRHNFIREARKQGVPSRISSSITGHSISNGRRNTADDYGKDSSGSYYDLNVLRNHIDKVRFDETLAGVIMPTDFIT